MRAWSRVTLTRNGTINESQRMDRVSIVEAKRDLSGVVNKAADGHEEFLRLGGLWKNTPIMSARELRAVRAQVWRRLAGR
jgi:hypothetical protein